jgi:hypothetical protein
MKLYYLVHKVQPLFPILSYINPVYALTAQFFNIRFNFILPFKSRSSEFPLTFTLTHKIHLTVLDLITLIIFGEKYKS